MRRTVANPAYSEPGSAGWPDSRGRGTATTTTTTGAAAVTAIVGGSGSRAVGGAAAADGELYEGAGPQSGCGPTLANGSASATGSVGARTYDLEEAPMNHTYEAPPDKTARTYVRMTRHVRAHTHTQTRTHTCHDHVLGGLCTLALSAP